VGRNGSLMAGRVLITGATGFIGRGLVPALSAAGYRVRAATRGFAPMPAEVESAVVGDLRKPINLAEAMRDVDFVVHSAGLAHATAGLDEETYREINAGVTAILARAAQQAGVKRFVLLSSIRAQTGPEADGVVTEATPARPSDAYGRSKLEGEEVLSESGIPAVVLRPVLVHGPGMRFNMAALMALARSRWPLPLGGFRAKRSIVAREHLADAVLLALAQPELKGETFLVADPEPLSAAEMIAALRTGLGRSPGLINLPPGLVALASRLAGRTEQVERLRQRLVVDPAKLLAAGWTPRRSAFDALVETARQYG
jgi:nucleoside-diphosphate-sugar epimerase